MKHLVIISILLIGCTGCLRNLNQSEFFRKLEIKKDSWYNLVVDNQSAFEASILKFVEEETDGSIEQITYWGEGRYACGKVIRQDFEDNDVLVVSGVFFLEGQKSKHLYSIYFKPNEGGELEQPILYY
jgi:hypothetical protein